MGFIWGRGKDNCKADFKNKNASKYLLAFFCLRRVTFCQQQQKVTKKCRSSGAGRADFPQITIEGSHRNLAYERSAFIKLIAGRNGAENHDCLE